MGAKKRANCKSAALLLTLALIGSACILVAMIRTQQSTWLSWIALLPHFFAIRRLQPQHALAWVVDADGWDNRAATVRHR